MTRLHDLAIVLRMAMLTEDRSDDEQRALLRVCLFLDRQLNANVTGNKRMWGAEAGDVRARRRRHPSTLYLEAQNTRVPVDGQSDVDLGPKVEAYYVRLNAEPKETVR